MKFKACLLKLVIGELFTDQTQSLLLAIEEKIMSVLTADLTTIKSEIATLKQNNSDLTASVADLTGKVDAANAALAAAQANAVDPADQQLIADIKQLLA